MKAIYFATSNRDKLLELKRIASPFNVQVLPAKNNGIEPEETGTSYEENAEIKFLYYEKLNLGLNSEQFLISEDSGFEIESLDGFPGVHSARFLKKFQSKQDAFTEIQKMLSQKLNISRDDVVKSKQKACFICDICVRIDGHVQHFASKISGFLNFQAGTDGFGYDPIFIPNDGHKTFAEMNGNEKDEQSHRSQAFLQLLHVIL